MLKLKRYAGDVEIVFCIWLYRLNGFGHLLFEHLVQVCELRNSLTILDVLGDVSVLTQAPHIARNSCFQCEGCGVYPLCEVAIVLSDRFLPVNEVPQVKQHNHQHD